MLSTWYHSSQAEVVRMTAEALGRASHEPAPAVAEHQAWSTRGVKVLVSGLTPVTPGQARVIQLFGKYRGTVRDPGLQWVNPFTRRIKVSTRIRNHETAQAKVNDADGNPIEIAAVVV